MYISTSKIKALKTNKILLSQRNTVVLKVVQVIIIIVIVITGLAPSLLSGLPTRLSNERAINECKTNS